MPSQCCIHSLCRVTSDEEAEDEEALLYLPVSPEIEEPEEAWQGDGPVSCNDNDNNNINDDNDCISRARFHVKHALLR